MNGPAGLAPDILVRVVLTYRHTLWMLLDTLANVGEGDSNLGFGLLGLLVALLTCLVLGGSGALGRLGAGVWILCLGAAASKQVVRC